MSFVPFHRTSIDWAWNLMWYTLYKSKKNIGIVFYPFQMIYCSFMKSFRSSRNYLFIVVILTVIDGVSFLSMKIVTQRYTNTPLYKIATQWKRIEWEKDRNGFLSAIQHNFSFHSVRFIIYSLLLLFRNNGFFVFHFWDACVHLDHQQITSHQLHCWEEHTHTQTHTQFKVMAFCVIWKKDENIYKDTRGSTRNILFPSNYLNYI